MNKSKGLLYMRWQIVAFYGLVTAFATACTGWGLYQALSSPEIGMVLFGFVVFLLGVVGVLTVGPVFGTQILIRIFKWSQGGEPPPRY